MRGYHRDKDATESAIDEEGWLHTGDLGRMDEEGYLRIRGRIKEQFKLSNGEFISPVRLKQTLANAFCR